MDDCDVHNGPVAPGDACRVSSKMDLAETPTRGPVRTPRVFVVCGSGLARSALIACRVREHLETDGVDAVVENGKLMDLLAADHDADLIVTTLSLPDMGVPVLDGMDVLLHDDSATLHRVCEILTATS